MIYDLSDDLARLADNFGQIGRDGLTMDGETVRGIVATLRSLNRAALELEWEVSRHRWNEQSRRDRARDMANTLAKAIRPGGNIVLFPVIGRPVANSRPGGAA